MASKSDIALIKALGGSSYTPKQAAALVRSLGGYVDPNFTLSYSGVAPEPRSSAGGSALGALKKIGSTALKALSVPQAIAFTTLQKSGHLLAPGAVRDMSWKNLGGSFYKNYKGGAGLLEGVGVSNGAVKRWGGLGLDIFADPLWFVAPVKAVKGSAKAKDLMYASKSTKKALRLSDGIAPFMGGGTTRVSGVIPGSLDELANVKKLAIRTSSNAQRAAKLLKKTDNVKGLADLKSASQSAARAAAKLKDGKGDLGAAMKALRGAAEKVDGVLGQVKGLNRNQAVILKPVKAVKAKSLKDLRGKDALNHAAKVFRTAWDDIGEAAEHMRAGTVTHAPKRFPGTGLKAQFTDADGYYDLGALVKEGLKSAEQQSGKTAGKWNLRIGTKKFNVELPTPISSKAKKLGEDGKVHAFKNSPEMELGHRARRMSDEAASAQLRALI